MKVIILSTHSAGGGAFVAASNLVDVLNEEIGYQARLVSLNIGDSLKDKIRFLFSSIFDRVLRKAFIRPTNSIFHSSGIFGKYSAEKIDAFEADLVVVHWFSNGLISPTQLAKIKTPYVLHIHDSWLVCGFEHHPSGSLFSNNIFDKWLYNSKREVIENAKGIIFPSLWQQSIFLGRGHIKAPIKVIPNIVPFPSRKHGSRSIHNSINEIVIGVVAHRVFNNVAKGGLELVNILEHLNEKLEKSSYSVVINIVGKCSRNIPPISLRLKNIRVQEMGPVDHSLMTEFFESIDLFLNPSRFENLSTTNIEACSFGNPIVCFDVGGNSEIVRDGVNGFLCEPFNCKDVSQHLFELVTNVKMRKSFSQESISIFENKFSSERVLTKTLKFYNEIFLK